MKSLSKILNQSLGRFYLIVAAIGIIVGLVITTFCIDVYDKLTSSVMKSSEQTHLIINKKVGLMNMLSLSDNSFTEEEITEMKNQDFIEDVGKIQTNSCRIWAFRDTEPLKFKTDIFFESLEDKFLDKIPNEWHWREDDDFVPVMINADFLNLYNFAFAKTQNLPQFTKSTVSQFVVFLEVRGNGKKRLFKARIVDVSDRIPSIIVPQKFLEYINNNFGKPNDGKYSRLMLEVSNPSEPKLKTFFQERDIIANEDILSSGKSKSILAKVLAGEISIAIIIVLLAAIIVILAFELLISNAKTDLELLKNLGFHSSELMQYFSKRFHTLFIVQLLIALGTSAGVGYYIKSYLEDSGYTNISILSFYALLIFALISGAYYSFFRWRIYQILKK